MTAEEIAHAMAQAVGLALREAREARDLKQFEVAARTGTSAAVLSRLEHGHRDVSLRHLFRLCEVLDVKLSDIFARAEELVSSADDTESDGHGG